MSLRGLLVHRMTILRMDWTDEDGVAAYAWTPVDTTGAPNRDVNGRLPCKVDLSYIRKGKDAGWVAEPGRPVDRAGVLFALIDVERPPLNLLPGDRVEVFNRMGRKIGTFECNGAFDTVDDRHGIPHHVEAGVTEVANALAEGAAPAPVGPGTPEP